MDQWKSVNDELPSEEDMYLCHFSDGTTETFAYFFDDEDDWSVGGTSIKVTHWMRIPEPPNKMEAA